jgi:hypothetical protein
LKRISRERRGLKVDVPKTVQGVDIPTNQQILVHGILAYSEEKDRFLSLLGDGILDALKAGPLIRCLLEGGGPDGPDQTIQLAFIRHNCHEAPTLEVSLAAAASIRAEFLLEKERTIQQQIREASQRNDLSMVQILNREKMAVMKERQALGRA